MIPMGLSLLFLGADPTLFSLNASAIKSLGIGVGNGLELATSGHLVSLEHEQTVHLRNPPPSVL
jgi:hypothetical protein